jgi:hypothetical protein
MVVGLELGTLMWPLHCTLWDIGIFDGGLGIAGKLHKLNLRGTLGKLFLATFDSP